MRTIATLLALITAAAVVASESEVPLVELGSRTKSDDGFYVKVDATRFPATMENSHAAVPELFFSLQVPADVGNTRVRKVFLKIEGDSRESLLEVLLDHRAHGREEWYVVNVAQSLAKNCAVHFEYGSKSEPERIQKDYIVRLKHHVPR